ncbi:hypothetical protein BGW41_001573 [Actinomortierella wolfii]|nr:hypothetical protein BGW41_001573 [Actinomortierella wolfii]
MPNAIQLCQLDCVEPERFVTSNIVRPKTLLAIRAVETLYLWISLIASWTLAKSIDQYLRFFTSLSFMGLCTYMLATCIWSIGYLRQPPADRAAWLHDRSPWWARLHQLLYSTAVCYHFVVPIVYWTMLSKGMKNFSNMEKWLNISVHALDGVVAVSELILNRNVLYSRHSIFVAVILTLYMCLTFVVYASEGTWVYSFLNWAKGPKVAISYIGIAIGLFVIYYVLLYVHRLRNRWGDRQPVVLELASQQEQQGEAKV